MKKYLQSYCEVNMFNIQFLKPEEKSSNRIEKNKTRYREVTEKNSNGS